MKRNFSIIFFMILLICLPFLLTLTSKKLASDTEDSLSGFDSFSDNFFSLEDFYVINHPVLENQYYEYVDISDIIDYESGLKVTYSSEGANGYYIYYIEDSIIYVLHSSDLEQLCGIVLVDNQYSFHNGLKIGMTLEELKSLDFVIKECPDCSDFSIGQIVRANLSEGALCKLQYDKIYTISGVLESDKVDSGNGTVSAIKGFVILCSQDKVIAIATDMPTAG